LKRAPPGLAGDLHVRQKLISIFLMPWPSASQRPPLVLKEKRPRSSRARSFASENRRRIASQKRA
jgi:hypothetical protein